MLLLTVLRPITAELSALWSSRIAPAAILAFALCASGATQESPNFKDEQECKDTTNTLCITKQQIDSLQPSPWGRFGRAWQYQYQLSEQPAFAAVAANGATQIIHNPEAYLNQHTLTFQFSELFPATSNLPAIVAALYAAKPDASKSDKLLRLDPKLCPSGHVIECLAAGGPFWERFLAATSVNFSVSERDQIQQGVLLSSFPSSQHYGPAGEVDFDPSSLFITGTAWQTAVAALKDINVDNSQLPDEERGCFVATVSNPGQSVGTGKTSQDSCVNTFSKPRLAASAEARTWTGIGAILIPKFQFKAVSQFDFIKNGGILVAVPGLQRSLKNYTFTWDLRRLIPSTTDRAAALKAYGSISSARSEKVAQPKVCVIVSGTSRGYMPVSDSFSASECGNLAEKARAMQFALACASSRSVVIGNSIDVRATPQTGDLPAGNACSW